MSTENLKRCAWAGNDPLYMDYHDNEWGKEVHDDKILFEFLVLESAQAGLSWITILRRRRVIIKRMLILMLHKVATFTDKDCRAIDAGYRASSEIV